MPKMFTSLYDELKSFYEPDNIYKDAPFHDNPSVRILEYNLSEFEGSIDRVLADMHAGLKGARPNTKFENVNDMIKLVNSLPKSYRYVFNIHYLNDGIDMATLTSKASPYDATMPNNEAVKYLKVQMNPVAPYTRSNTWANHEHHITKDVNIVVQEQLGLPDVYSEGPTLMIFNYKNCTVKLLETHIFNEGAILMAEKMGCDILYAAHTHQPLVATRLYIGTDPVTHKPVKKNLNIMVANSAVLHAPYQSRVNGQPSNITDIISEMVQTKQQDGTYTMRQNFLDGNHIIGLENSLRETQVEKVNSKQAKLQEMVERKVQSLQHLSPKQARLNALMFGFKLRSNLMDLEKKYEAQLQKEEAMAQRDARETVLERTK